MNGPRTGFNTWRSRPNANEVPFRKRIFKAWGPMIVLQMGVLAVVLNIKKNEEETKVPIHGGNSPFMNPTQLKTNNSDIREQMDAQRLAQGKSKVSTTPSEGPYKQPRSGSY